MKTILLFASFSVASGLLFTNIYTSLVDAGSWGSHIPESIATAREYYKTVNPGNFFRIFSPINQLLALLSLIAFWKVSRTIRVYLGVALLMYILAEALTFGYFYPRNDILFNTTALTDIDILRKAWSEWSRMNWIRSLLGVMGLVFSFLALHKIYSMRMA